MTEHKEPSLGPACLVVVILSLAAFCAFCGFGSWIMFADQFPYAQKGIQQQLIPWVEQSQLAKEDKESIVAQLNDLLPVLENREISRNQLLRLRNCLQDNAVLLWGGVQSILAQSESVDLSDTERTALRRLTERLMLMAVDRMLARNDLEFTLQPCSVVRQDKTGLEVTPGLTADQIRKFMQRAEQLLKQNKVDNEPCDTTPAEAFKILTDAALRVNPAAG